MKLKQLESILGNVSQFSSPKIELEQYPTGPHIASRMLYMAENSYGDISDKVVADLGCGCGTLGIAAALLEAGLIKLQTDKQSNCAVCLMGFNPPRSSCPCELTVEPNRKAKSMMNDRICVLITASSEFLKAPLRHVLGVDVDYEALEIAQNNVFELEVEMDLIQASIENLPWRGPVVNTVVMNPPFGTRRKGVDMAFLSAALKIADTAVYSLHKSSTREHVKRSALRDFGAKSADVLFELRYDLPTSYKFHKKREVDIAVDLWRFTV